LTAHAGQQQVLAVVQQLLDRLVGRDFGGMRIRHQHQPDIAVVLVDGDHIGHGAEREFFAERADRGRGVHRLHVFAHHAADGKIAHPADVGGAADGLAAQMETQWRTSSQSLPASPARRDHGDQHRGRQPQVAGGLQRNEDHGQRNRR